jgi:hypothetical protein
VVTETKSDFAKRHLKDVIIDVYAADIITDELDVRETLLIPQSKEWFKNAKVLPTTALRTRVNTCDISTSNATR